MIKILSLVLYALSLVGTLVFFIVGVAVMGYPVFDTLFISLAFAAILSMLTLAVNLLTIVISRLSEISYHTNKDE